LYDDLSQLSQHELFVEIVTYIFYSVPTDWLQKNNVWNFCSNCKTVWSNYNQGSAYKQCHGFLCESYFPDAALNFRHVSSLVAIINSNQCWAIIVIKIVCQLIKKITNANYN